MEGDLGFTEKQKAELADIISQKLSLVEEKYADIFEFVRHVMTLPQFAKKVQKANEVRRPGKAPLKPNLENEPKKDLLMPQTNGKKERSKTSSNTRDVKLPTTRQKLPEKEPPPKAIHKELKKATTEARKTFTKDFKKQQQKKPPVGGTSRNNKTMKAYHTQASPSQKLVETRKLVDLNRKDFEFVDTASVLSPTFANKLKTHTFESKGEETKKTKLNEELETSLSKLKKCYSSSLLDDILNDKAITQDQVSTLLKELSDKVTLLEAEIKDLGTKELPVVELGETEITVDSLAKPLSAEEMQAYKILLATFGKWDLVTIDDANTFTEKAQEYLKDKVLREEITKRIPLLTGEDIFKLKSLITNGTNVKECKEPLCKDFVLPILKAIEANGYFELKQKEYERTTLQEAIDKLNSLL